MRRLLLLVVIGASCTSATPAAPMDWPDRPAAPLRVGVSANGRYFVDQEGQPVFWLGTTQWELFRGYTLEDAQLILDKSKDKGFVFVQTMLVGVGDGTRTNVYGQKPWLNDDPLTPNEAYFRNVDAVIQAARERDLILYVMPYHQTCRKHITFDNARSWAKWLAQRYKEMPNIVWSLIPEAKPAFVPLLRELAAGLREGDGGAHLITVEPDPSPYSSSFIHGEKWLDFNSLQTWKSVELIYPMVTHDYDLKPVKPVLMAEGAYEQGSEYGFEVSPLWIRRQAYYSYLAGGHHAYGHNDSWRILPTWRQALDAPGARQMGILRKIFEARPEWWRLVPDQSLFAVGGQTKGRVLHLAARHLEGKWAMIYLADSVEFSVNPAHLRDPHVSASWVNPATGESVAGGSYTNAAVQSFTTPVGWEDSLLILESAAANAAPAPSGAAALGYTKGVINEKPTAADIASGRNGDYKWFSGQWWHSKKPPLSKYSTEDGVLTLSLGGDLVSTPHDFSRGTLPLLPGRDGFYVEFEYWLSDADPDHFPAVWLMPAEHNGARQDHYAGDPPGYERWMELDVDEGGFGPGLTGTVHSNYGIYEQGYKHIQNPNNVSRVTVDRTKKHTFGASYDPQSQTVTWWGRWRQTDERRLALGSGCRSQAEFLPDRERPEPRETETILPVRQRREGLGAADLLRHTVVIPSRVELGEPYLYAHWLGARGVLVVRHPSNESREYVLDLSKAGAPSELAEAICYTQYPYRRGIAADLTGHSHVQLKLAPWELLFLEVVARSQRKETVVIGARWYLCSIAAGSHRVKFSGTAGHPNPRLGLWLGADQDLADRTPLASFRCSDPAMPPYRDRLERQGVCLMPPTAGRSGSA